MPRQLTLLNKVRRIVKGEGSLFGKILKDGKGNIKSMS